MRFDCICCRAVTCLEGVSSQEDWESGWKPGWELQWSLRCHQRNSSEPTDVRLVSCLDSSRDPTRRKREASHLKFDFCSNPTTCSSSYQLSDQTHRRNRPTPPLRAPHFRLTELDRRRPPRAIRILPIEPGARYRHTMLASRVRAAPALRQCLRQAQIQRPAFVSVSLDAHVEEREWQY